MKCRSVVLLSAFVLCARALCAAEDFGAWAPKDAFLYMGIGNVTQFREGAKQTPAGRLWADPEMVKFTQPGRTKCQTWVNGLADQTGMSLEKFLGLFPGQVAFWLESLDPYKPGEFGLVFVADRTEPPDAYRGLIDKGLETWAPPETKKTKIDAEGVEIFSVQWEDAAATGPVPETQASAPAPAPAKGASHSLLYAFPEGKFILAVDGDESIQRLLARKKAGESLAQNPGFRPMAQAFQGAQSRLFVNIEALLKMAFGMAPARQAEERANALGARSLLDLAYVVDVAGGKMRYFSKVRTIENPTGLARIVTSFRPLSTNLLRAAPEEPWSVVAFGLDIPLAFQEIIKTLRMVVPQFDANWAPITTVAQLYTGLSLESQIIPALGDQLCFYTVSPPGAATQQAMPTFILSLRKAEVISQLCETLMKNPQISAYLQKNDFLGASVYTFQTPSSPVVMSSGAPIPQPAFGVANNCLVFSFSSDEAREAIRRLAGKNARNFLDAGKRYHPAPERRGLQFAGYAFQNLDLQAEAMVQGVNQMQAALGMAGLATGHSIDLSQWIDFQAVPQASTIQRYVEPKESYTYKAPDGILGE